MRDPTKTTIMLDLNTDLRQRVNSAASHIEIYCNGKSMAFSRAELPIKIGRDGNVCQIVVNRDVTSRIHCHLTVQDNQIGIVDTSQNGTFLRIGSNDSFVIKGAFFPLIGQGKIRLGEPFPNNDSDTLLFRMVNRKQGE